MSKETDKLKARIAVLEGEIAGASGLLLAIAEHFEREFGADDDLAIKLHHDAARLRKLARLRPPNEQ